jgi:hypothetical protein
MGQLSAPLIDFDYNIALLEKAYNRLDRNAQRSFGKIVLQQSRLTSWNLARVTHPWNKDYGNGMDKGTQRVGEAAVARDIGNIFKAASAIYKELKAEDEKLAKMWWKAVKAGQLDLASILLRRSDLRDRNAQIGELDPAVHQKQRNSRGRVSTRHRAEIIVPDAKTIKAYIKERQKSVGFAKAGWISAGTDLGRVTRVPAWITRHVGKAPGHAIDNSKGIDPHCILVNNVNYVSQILPQNQFAKVINSSLDSFLKHIDHVIAAEAKAAGFIVTNTGTESRQLAAA